MEAHAYQEERNDYEGENLPVGIRIIIKEQGK